MAGRRKKFVLVERPSSGHAGDGKALEALFHWDRTGSEPNGTRLSPASPTSSAAASAPSARGALEVPTSNGRIRVLDTVGSVDAALVQMTEDQAEGLARLLPNVVVREAVTLFPMRASPDQLVRQTVRRSSVPSGRSLSIQVRDARTRLPIAGASVTVVFDMKRRSGYGDLKTGPDGTVSVAVPKKVRRVDAVFCHPLKGYWPAKQTDTVTVSGGHTTISVSCAPIEPNWRDSLAQLVSAPAPDAGKGVRVAVVDAGVTPGPGLAVKVGRNTTGLEPEADWQDRGDGHGTHVAGIIARIAPGAEIYAYRVFSADMIGADEIPIARAIRFAINDGCDIINLSLGNNAEPAAVMEAVNRAWDSGVLCVAAAGNDYMSDVSWPAAGESVTAVSACGLEGAWPELASTGDAKADEPPMVDGVFFANFSNVGKQIDLTAPGVGVISKVTAHEIGVMDGTSMACPAVAAQLARLLSKESDLLTAPRDSARSARLAQLASNVAKQIGFGQLYEGRGRLP